MAAKEEQEIKDIKDVPESTLEKLSNNKGEED